MSALDDLPTTYDPRSVESDMNRLWVDGKLLIDRWHDGTATYTADVNLSGGTHALRMEYYEHTGGAMARLSWAKQQATITDWKGEYYNNRDLAGSPVSPGSVTGPVRVVSDPRRAGLLPGEILVCRGTDPSWTPLFLTAGGLVMEVGGLMTHGAVVAREYGIPAVVGVDRATERLQTGQLISLDGSTGRITIVDAAGASTEDETWRP